MIHLSLFITLLLAACGRTAEPEPEPQTSKVAPHADMKQDDATTHGDAMPHDGEMKAGPAVYACPMHPDISADEPGECSKCGMALVEQKEHDHSSHDHGEHDGPTDDHGH